ncbi:MAG: hypothetical protein QE487_19140 [Fluviicola sp.]|nr:hypothetical protein [Fluviicola sp.]
MDMQALIEEMSALIVKIKSGVATQGELEAFAAAASELNERAIILRYKSYEAKVFGTPAKPIAEPISETKVESPAADAIPESEIVNNESTAVDAQFIAHSDEIVIENETETDNSELSFDLFSMDDVDARFIAHSDESTNNESVSEEPISATETNPQNGIGAEEEMEAPILHEEVPEVELADDESLMIYPEEGIEAAIEHIENTTPEAEPAADAQFIAHSDESTNNESVSEKPISETDTAFADEVPAQETITTTEAIPSGEEHPVYKRLSNEDNSLAARLMAVRLETLKGAFGFNERLQIIKELFDGSNDDFTQAIERLDTLNSKNEARNIVSTIAHQYAWDKDSNLALEFIQKVERRYA